MKSKYDSDETKNDLKIPRSRLCKDRRGESYCLKHVLAKGDACKNKPVKYILYNKF
jgi:hypothetical protein